MAAKPGPAPVSSGVDRQPELPRGTTRLAPSLLPCPGAEMAGGVQPTTLQENKTGKGWDLCQPLEQPALTSHRAEHSWGSASPHAPGQRPSRWVSRPCTACGTAAMGKALGHSTACSWVASSHLLHHRPFPTVSLSRPPHASPTAPAPWGSGRVPCDSVVLSPEPRMRAGAACRGAGRKNGGNGSEFGACRLVSAPLCWAGSTIAKYRGRDSQCWVGTRAGRKGKKTRHVFKIKMSVNEK